MRFIKDNTPIVNENDKVLYRYNDIWTFDMYGDALTQVRLVKYPIIKETPCGYWIRHQYWSQDKKRWVSKDGLRAYAKDTEDKALDSYIARKWKQVCIIERNLEHAKQGLKLGIELRGEKKTQQS